jgi:hypothetical protein
VALREQLADSAEEAAECRRQYDAEWDRAEAAKAVAKESTRECSEATAARESLEWRLEVGLADIARHVIGCRSTPVSVAAFGGVRGKSYRIPETGSTLRNEG